MLKHALQFIPAATMSLLFCLVIGFAVTTTSPRLGTYTMSIAPDDVLTNVPAEVRSNLDGKWEMTFAKGGKYQISKDGSIVVEGRFTSAKEELTLTDEKGPLACSQQPGMETGTYKWNYQKELTFTVVSDNCQGRHAVLTVHPWLKVK